MVFCGPGQKSKGTGLVSRERTGEQGAPGCNEVELKRWVRLTELDDGMRLEFPCRFNKISIEFLSGHRPDHSRGQCLQFSISPVLLFYIRKPYH